MEQDSLITSEDEVAGIASQIAECGAFALDLEFVSEDRYVPDLALVQLAWGDVEDPDLAVVDPVAVDPKPILELVADSKVETIIHGGKQDLGLLSTRYQVRGAGTIDTQIAAAMAGIADQIGYGRLMDRLLGVAIDKGHQFTDWLRRPLSSKQLRYALDDVRYLPRSWKLLEAQLSELGRLQWAREESELLARDAATRPPPEEAYVKVGGWKALRGESLGAARSLAAWREREALSTNRPPSWIVPDSALIELCKRAPKSARDLKAVRGVGQGTVDRYGTAILSSLDAGRREPAVEIAPRPQMTHREQAQTLVLAGLILGKGEEIQISPRLLGSRADAEDLVRWNGNDSGEQPRLLRGWRAEVIGRDALAWLRGQRGISFDQESGCVVSWPRSESN